MHHEKLVKFDSCIPHVVSIQNAFFWGVERTNATSEKFQKWDVIKENQKLQFLSVFFLDIKNNFTATLNQNVLCWGDYNFSRVWDLLAYNCDGYKYFNLWTFH